MTARYPILLAALASILLLGAQTPRLVGAAGSPDAAPPHSPDIVVIDSLANHYGPVVFDHELHAGMSRLNDGCTNCHHGSASNAVVEPCQSCHPHERTRVDIARPGLKGAYHRQCLGCHRDWNHGNACGSCHEETSSAPEGERPITVVDLHAGREHPAITAKELYVYRTGHGPSPIVGFHHMDHAESFGLRCVDCHQGQSCGRCHDANAKPREIDRHENCGSCHDVERNCALCHRPGEATPRFDHATIAGWTLDPQHSTVACKACHGPAATFKTPSSTNCRACHGRSVPEPFDHAVTGVPLLGSHAQFPCQRCHISREVDARASCNGCHPDKAYPAQRPGMRD